MTLSPTSAGIFRALSAFAIVLCLVAGCDRFRTASRGTASPAPQTQSGETPPDPVAVPIDRLSIQGPDTIEANECAVFHIEAGDATGPLATVDALPLQLTHSGVGEFYSDGACRNAITSTVLPPGRYQTDVFFSAGSAQTINLRVSAIGIAAGTQMLTVLGQANLVFQSGLEHDFGWFESGAESTAYLFIENTGSATATLVAPAAPLVAPFAYAGGNYPGTFGNCGTELLPSSSCLIAISFHPTTQNIFSSELTLSYFDALGPQSVTLTLHGRSINGGDLDVSFATDGKQTVAFSNLPNAAFNDYAYAGQIQTDGRLLLGGTTYDTTGSHFALARLLSSGALDTTFGDLGKRVISFDGPSTGRALQIQTDGKILIGGYATIAAKNHFALARLLPSGALDSTFGTAGLVTTSFPRAAMAYGLVVDSNGRAQLIGATSTLTGNQVAIARYRTNGSLDTGFATQGRLTHSLAGFTSTIAYSGVLDSSGNLTVSGLAADNARSYFMSQRFTPTGAFDSTFGTAGKSQVAIPDDNRALASARLADGSFLQVGARTLGSRSDFAFARLLADGALDTSFASQGIGITDLDSPNASATAVLENEEGEILIGGYADGFALLRLLPNGTLDSTFNHSGIVKTQIGSGPDQAHALAEDAQGGIYLIGRSFNGLNYDFAVVKYAP